MVLGMYCVWCWVWYWKCTGSVQYWKCIGSIQPVQTCSSIPGNLALASMWSAFSPPMLSWGGPAVIVPFQWKVFEASFSYKPEEKRERERVGGERAEKERKSVLDGGLLCTLYSVVMCCCVVQCCNVLYCAVWCVVQCCTVLHCALHCCTVLVHCCTVVHCVAQSQGRLTIHGQRHGTADKRKIAQWKVIVLPRFLVLVQCLGVAFGGAGGKTRLNFIGALFPHLRVLAVGQQACFF